MKNRPFILALIMLCATINDLTGADPAGTVSVVMHNHNNGKTLISNTVYLDGNNNFVGAAFVSAGIVSGIDDIVFVPKMGWRTSIPAKPGRGIIADINGTYYRIFVESPVLENPGNDIVGMKVKYQQPFYGEPTGQTDVSSRLVAFPSSGGKQIVYIKSPGNVPFKTNLPPFSDYKVTKGRAHERSKWTHVIEIESDVNERTVNHNETLSIVYPNGAVEEIKLLTYAAGHTPTPQRNVLKVGPEASDDNYMIIYTISHYLTANSDSGWCSVRSDIEYSANRGMVYFSVTENDTGKERLATVSVTGNDGTAAEFDVLQAPYTFRLSEDGARIDRLVNEFEVTAITSLTEWETYCDASWLKCNWIGKTLFIKADLNRTERMRYGTVMFRTKDGYEKKYTVAQSPYAAGDYFERGADQGVIIEAKGNYVKIMSLDESGGLQWSTVVSRAGASSHSDGYANSHAVTGIPRYRESYPAFGWADKHNSVTSNGWYIPSEKELGLIMANARLIDKTLTEIKGARTLSMNKKYWSSTEVPGGTSDMAYACIPNRSKAEPTAKKEKHYVRVVKNVDLEF